MKRQFWIVGVVVMLLATLLVFLFRKKIFPGASATAGTNSEPMSEFPLSRSRGSQGEKVKALQAHINKMWGLTPVSRDYMPLVEDGIFGVKTEAACKLFLGTESVSESWYNQFIK